MNNSILTIPHFGAYGIIKHEDTILLLCNSHAPYKGLLDLPGGQIKGFEPTQKALKREIKVQTGLKINKYEMIGYYECLVPIDDKSEMNHRGMIYDIQKYSGKIQTVTATQWHNPLDLKESQLTPFAWQAVQHYLKANFHIRVHKRLSNSSAFSTDK